MSVFDRFLNVIRLNDDDYDEEDFFDEEDDDLDDSAPSRRFLKNTDDDLDFDEDPEPAPRRAAKPARQESAPAPKPIRKARSPKVSAFRPRREQQETSDNNYSVCVIRPKSMEDALQIAQTLIAHCTVILNLEGLDLDVSQRIFDFASGACCAIRGRLDKISNYIFVLTPEGVNISGEFQEILTGAFDPDLDLDEDL